MFHSFVVVLLSSSLLFQFTSRERMLVPSPDRELSAFLIYYGDKNSPRTESKIEIRSRHRRPLCMVNFRTRHQKHGMRILGGTWTPDSRFFVFNGAYTDGYDPGHYPTYFYCRRDNVIRRLDPYTGSWIARTTIGVSASDSVTVVIHNPTSNGTETIAWSADLRNLVASK